MARMSIDDMFLRDPRVTRLGAQLGVSKYEVRGRLLDVFAIGYDRVNAGDDGTLTPEDIDEAAAMPGFTVQMCAVGLADMTDDARVRVRGLGKYAGYLQDPAERGRLGGIKSGETRRAAKQTKQTGEANEATNEAKRFASEASLKVSVSVPDLVSVPDPVVVVAPASPRSRAARKQPASALPVDWQPTKQHGELAISRGLDVSHELAKFRAHAEANDRRAVRWNAAFTQWLLNSRALQTTPGRAAETPFDRQMARIRALEAAEQLEMLGGSHDAG